MFLKRLSSFLSAQPPAAVEESLRIEHPGHQESIGQGGVHTTQVVTGRTWVGPHALRAKLEMPLSYPHYTAATQSDRPKEDGGQLERYTQEITFSDFYRPLRDEQAGLGGGTPDVQGDYPVKPVAAGKEAAKRHPADWAGVRWYARLA